MNKNIKALCLLSLISTIPACVPMANNNALQEQIDAQNLQIERLNAQLSNMQPAQADSWVQLQSMNQEMAMMRGSLDDLEYRLRDANLQLMQAQIAEHDRALRAAETQLGVELQLGESISAPQYAPIPPSDAAPLTQDIDVNIAPLAAVTASTAISSTTTALSAIGELDDTEIITEEIPELASNASADDKTAQLLYDAGIKAFNERKYQNALKSFTDFANVYKDHTLVSNALFWQGECHYQLKNYPAAALAYEKVIAGYPNGNKAPASYLKQGMTFSALDRKDAAKERYTQLVEIYPKAPEATRAREYLKNY